MTTVNLQEIKAAEDDLLDYINKQSNKVETRPAGFGITTPEYVKASGRAFTTARRQLMSLVKNGKLQSKPMIERGHIVTVYYK